MAQRKKKVRSAAELREHVTTHLLELGGTVRRESAHNSVTGCVLGGDVLLPLSKGALLVHLPSDDFSGVGLSIHTRFIEGATLPASANPYSGKWNFSCYEREGELFEHFTKALDRVRGAA